MRSMRPLRLIPSLTVFARTLAAKATGRPAPRVYAIGFNKTGTTSLHHIFTDLGYLSFHGTIWRRTRHLWLHFFYEAFCDGVPEDFRRLDAMFPGSKFILQVRNLDEWLDSRLEHITRLPNTGGRGRSADWTADDASVISWVKKREAYHAEVLRHFADRPDDFLLVNYIRDADAAAKIAAFLGHPAPAEKPHSNKNPNKAKTLRHAETIARVLGGLGIPESEWRNDLLCPSLDGAPAGLPGDSQAAA